MKIKSLFALGLFAVAKSLESQDDFFLRENEKEISDDVHKTFFESQPNRYFEFLDDEQIKQYNADKELIKIENDQDFSFNLRGSDTKMRFNHG